MGGIFLSYRREDSAGWTGRLSEHLKDRFGPESIFMDIETIEPGADFTEALQKAVSACDVLLAIIGPDWATAADPSGKPRLDDPTDWVRVEIATALKRNIRVIPVLVGGASVPTTDLLPDELDRLAHRQAHELTDKRWDYDVEQLAKALPSTRQIPPASPKATPASSSTWRLNPTLIGGILFMLGIVVWNNLPSSKTDVPSENKDRPQPASPAPVTAIPEKPTASTPPPATPSAPPASSPRSAQAINLLAAENGGHLIVTSGADWAHTIDGKEGFNQISDGLTSQSEAVYAFKDERSATIDRFTMLIAGTSDANVKEFELFVGTDSPTGAFDSIGTFQTQNVKLLKTPYQEFQFPPTKAKYLKIRLRSSYGFRHPLMSEVQLFGRLDPGPPALSAPPAPSPRSTQAINLLDAENGGHLIVTSGDAWAGTIDGKEGFNQISDGLTSQSEAVYAFKDERSATIDRFTMLIPGTGDNTIKEFELFMGNDSPTGSFESLGKFQTQNVKLLKTPYQEFKLPPVKTKYLKIKLLSTYGSRHPMVPEVQLFGRLDSVTNAPPAASPAPGPRVPKAINLLAAENGGHLIVTSGADWAHTIDGKEDVTQINYGLTEQTEAVYAFKNERSATIDRFTMLMAGTSDANVKEFELFVGTDSPTGAFDSLGTFQTQNVKLLKTPYQEFRFPPTKAKYLKIRLRSTYGSRHPLMSEVQLFGRLDPE